MPTSLMFICVCVSCFVRVMVHLLLQLDFTLEGSVGCSDFGAGPLVLAGPQTILLWGRGFHNTLPGPAGWSLGSQAVSHSKQSDPLCLSSLASWGFKCRLHPLQAGPSNNPSLPFHPLPPRSSLARYCWFGDNWGNPTQFHTAVACLALGMAAQS